MPGGHHLAGTKNKSPAIGAAPGQQYTRSVKWLITTLRPLRSPSLAISLYSHSLWWWTIRKKAAEQSLVHHSKVLIQHGHIGGCLQGSSSAGTGSLSILPNRINHAVTDISRDVASEDKKSIFGGPVPAWWDSGRGSLDSGKHSSIYPSARMPN